MKVNACITTTIHVNLDVNDPSFEELYKVHKESVYKSAGEEVYEKAVKVIEEKLGLPFGDDDATTTIVGVYSEDAIPIIEW